MHQLMHHVSCRIFWWNIKSLRWLSTAKAQIWHPVTSGFSKNQNHLWKRRDFRLLMRFREMQWLGKLCEVPRYLIWRTLKRHCPMYNVPCIFFNKCFYFSYYVAGYFPYTLSYNNYITILYKILNINMLYNFI